MPPDATSRWPRARPPMPAPMISTRSGVRVMRSSVVSRHLVGWGEREGQFVDHPVVPGDLGFQPDEAVFEAQGLGAPQVGLGLGVEHPDRKSTRLNSSHVEISYAVFCLKKKKEKYESV